jgi:hypothetical protein
MCILVRQQLEYTLKSKTEKKRNETLWSLLVGAQVLACPLPPD